VKNIGGAIPPDQYLPFATGSRIPVSQGANMPCGQGFDHVSPSCNSYYGPYNQWAWDFAVPTGTPIHAAIGGLVIRAGFENGGYGNTIVVQTSRNDCSRYEHLSEVDVHVGQAVSTYDLIGKTGATGNVTGPHLHYGREDCQTAYSLQSSFIDVGNPARGQTVTSGNHAGATPGGGGNQPAGCPPNCMVYGASAGVNVRKAPSVSSPSLSVLPNNTPITIACQTNGDSVYGSTIWDQLTVGGYVSDYYVNTPVTGAFSPGLSQCPLPSTGGSGTPPPPPSTTPPVNRTAITSYNRMSPGAPYHGQFIYAFQAFTAASNTITSIGVTVGNVNYPAGQPAAFNVPIRLCTNQPDSSGACNVIGQVSPQVVNYGDSQGDIGDVAVTPGTTYWVEYYPPQAYGNGWVTYWWSGGSTIAASEQMQIVVKGYNR
jgi:hypothetical protein